MRLPFVSLLRLARLLRRREIVDAMEARAVSAWPWAGPARRAAWLAGAQQGLAALAPVMETPDQLVSDPAVKRHVRALQASLRQGATHA